MEKKKKIYKNQKEILENFLEYIYPFFKKTPEIKEAYLWGSLAKEEFGTYKRPYNGKTESDVDLVLFFTLQSNIPKDWKNLNDPHSWFNIYKCQEYRNFKYKNHIHKVDFLVAHKDKSVKDLKKTNKKIKSKFFKIYEK